jgi:hypothetical protein
MSDRTVELIPAFEWTCPRCGRHHFARVVRLEPENHPEEYAEARDGGLEGDLCIAPVTVRCPPCHAEFGTIDL